MNHFDPIALVELGALVLGSWHDFFVALDGDQRVRQTERGQQLFHSRPLPDLPFFAVDHELHGP